MCRFLKLEYLFSNLVRYWKHKLTAETEVCAHALRKIFRRVVWIIDVPLELVTYNHFADSHIDCY